MCSHCGDLERQLAEAHTDYNGGPVPDPSEIPYGYCHCGCGGKTSVVGGEPKRFIRFHVVRVTHAQEDWGYVTPCWIWQGSVNGSGYGQIGRGGKLFMAHRFYYEHYHGPISEGLHIDHLCRQKRCVNPDHLEPVTPLENIRRGILTPLNAQMVREIIELREQLIAGSRTKAGKIRQRVPNGATAGVAAQYGVSENTIQGIWSGRQWADISRSGAAHV